MKDPTGHTVEYDPGEPPEIDYDEEAEYRQTRHMLASKTALISKLVDEALRDKAENERLRADYERMWSALQAETATGVQMRGELRAEITRLHVEVLQLQRERNIWEARARTAEGRL